MMVTSILDTLRMVSGALAATSTYGVMVGSKWGRLYEGWRKKRRQRGTEYMTNGKEEQFDR